MGSIEISLKLLLPCPKGGRRSFVLELVGLKLRGRRLSRRTWSSKLYRIGCCFSSGVTVMKDLENVIRTLIEDLRELLNFLLMVLSFGVF